ncbi:MAG: hypothetical protein HFF06_06090 [Oscillospiraceae bacterium]|jgi:hypothetical protein|nr:hypothetical protein [Oscillospiraceae bacterium]
MTDRELFQKAVKSLPSLAPPLLGTVLVSWLMAEIFPRALFSMVFGKEENIGERFGLLLFLLAVWILLCGMADLLRLGAFRLCLERGEGEPGAMPWSILPQWRRYIGWVLWTAVLSILWRFGQRFLDSLVVGQLDYRQIESFFAGKAYVNVVLTLLSLLMVSLLVLSIKTAYLRVPKQGFWHAVGFGLEEGLKKWSGTVWPYLKFVVPVFVGTGFMGTLLVNVAFRTGRDEAILLCQVGVQLLRLLGSVWSTVFCGHLAAARYDKEPIVPGRTEETSEEEKSVAARFAEGLMGPPSPLFPARREMRLIRGGPWYYRDGKKGPTIPGPLERK